MAKRAGRSRQRRPRTLSPRLIVACEGEKTEFEYLTRLNQSLKPKSGPALVPLRGRGKGAVGVVKQAIRQRDQDRQGQKFSKRDGDRVYALIDVEPHDPSKAAALQQALALAGKEGVCVLLSNPSFEFWLLCHVAEANDLCRSFADPQALDQGLRNRGYPGKDDLHQNPNLFDRFLPKAQHAVTVARHVHEQHHRSPTDIRTANACTQVYELVARMVEPGPS